MILKGSIHCINLGEGIACTDELRLNDWLYFSITEPFSYTYQSIEITCIAYAIQVDESAAVV